MAKIAWHDEVTRRKVEALVREVESKSSAEIVVTVRPRSGSYRAADFIFGALVALAGLCVYVYAPTEFTDDLAPPSIVLLFFAGMAFAARVPALQRLLTPRKIRAANVRADERTTIQRTRMRQRGSEEDGAPVLPHCGGLRSNA